MKQFKVVALSSKIICQSWTLKANLMNSHSKASKLPLLENLIGKNIECTLNKNATHIRYQNEAFSLNRYKQVQLKLSPKNQKKQESTMQNKKLDSLNAKRNQNKSIWRQSMCSLVAKISLNYFREEEKSKLTSNGLLKRQ